MVNDRAWRCRRTILATAVLGGLMMFGLAACGASRVASRSTSTTSSKSVSSKIPSTTTPESTTASLRVVTCPTTYGVTRPPTTAPLPTSMNLTIPRVLAGELAVYADSQGRMQLLAPTGWTCSAEYGADGSGGLAIYPTGESVSHTAFGAGWTLSPHSLTEAIVGSQTGGCQGCGVAQACPLFAIAARSFQSQFGRACPKGRPASETAHQITPGIVAFQDPPAVSGDGSPSGGRYAARWGDDVLLQ
jgi:hypothetical protein